MEKRGRLLIIVILFFIIGIVAGFTLFEYQNNKKEREERLEVENSYNSLGFDYYYALDHNSAIEEFNKYLEDDDQNYHAYSGLGWSYYFLEDYDSALLNFIKAVELNPNDADVWDGLGLSYMAKSDYNDAEEAFTKAVELDSDNALYYMRLGALQLIVLRLPLGEYDKAKEVIKGSSDAQILESTFEYLKKAESMPNSQDVSSISRMYGNAYYTKTFMDNNYPLDFSLAKESYLKFVNEKASVEYPLSYTNLGLIHLYEHEYTESIAFFSKAMEVGGDELPVLTGLAYATLFAGKLDTAKEMFEPLAIEGSNGLSHAGLGFVMLEQGNLESAEQHFLDSLEIDSVSSVPELGLSLVYEQTGNSNKQEEFSSEHQKKLESFKMNNDLHNVNLYRKIISLSVDDFYLNYKILVLDLKARATA